MRTEDAVAASLFIVLISVLIFVLTVVIYEPTSKHYPLYNQTGVVFEFSVSDQKVISVHRNTPVNVTIRSSKAFKLRNMQTNEVISPVVSEDNYFLTSPLPYGGWLVEAEATCYVTASPDPTDPTEKILSVTTSQEGRSRTLNFLFLRLYPALFVLAQAVVWIIWLSARIRAARPRSRSTNS
jgi:hypothetical protein